MARRAKTEKEYRTVGSDRRISWAGGILPNSALEHTQWRCSHGHLFVARYNDLQQGRGCPYCSGKAHKRREDYEHLGQQKGFALVGDVPPTTREKAKWRGPNGKLILVTYHSMNSRKDLEIGPLNGNNHDRHELDSEGAGAIRSSQASR